MASNLQPVWLVWPYKECKLVEAHKPSYHDKVQTTLVSMSIFVDNVKKM